MLTKARWFIFLGCVFMSIMLLIAPVIYVALVYDANQEEPPRRHNHGIQLVGFQWLMSLLVGFLDDKVEALLGSADI